MALVPPPALTAALALVSAVRARPRAVVVLGVALGLLGVAGLAAPPLRRVSQPFLAAALRAALLPPRLPPFLAMTYALVE